MPHHPVSLHAPRGSVAADVIREGIDALLADDGLQVPQEFPPEILAEAERAATAAAEQTERIDRTELPLVTLDPATSTDLDQAMHLERRGDGYRVRYAIADVPAFVELDGRLDEEARRRGTTIYLPDRRIPLHPPILSEGAASLLPQQPTPAYLWVLDLDASGHVTNVDLERALVRSVEKLAYDQVQSDLDAGEGHPTMLLLEEIGHLRSALEAERGGASLNVPEQEVVAENGVVRLRWRRPNPIEDANAQISLMTGMAAADLMLTHGAGILRTMPPAQDSAIERFRRQSEVLGVPWHDGIPYGRFLRSLDWREPAHLALLNQATSLFRGASYAAFTAAAEIPDDPVQAAIAAPYAHTTAPLRRLVDRFVLLVCHAHVDGRDVDPALLEALKVIPDAMRSTGSRAAALESRATDLVESAALSAWTGEEFDATVIERREATTSEDGNGGAPLRVEVQLTQPPVTAWVPMDARVGEVVRIRLTSVDAATGTAEFAPTEHPEHTELTDQKDQQEER